MSASKVSQVGGLSARLGRDQAVAAIRTRNLNEARLEIIVISLLGAAPVPYPSTLDHDQPSFPHPSESRRPRQECRAGRAFTQVQPCRKRSEEPSPRCKPATSRPAVCARAIRSASTFTFHFAACAV